MKICVEVVYALPDRQSMIELQLEDGACVADALARCETRLGQLPGVDYIGIWGRPATPQTRLRDHDRVEIYRELVADPKQARRRRASQQRAARSRR